MNLAFRGAAGDDGKPRLPGSLHVNRRLDRWLAFPAEGVVEIRPGKVELGQGILTALTQIAAEELEVALPRIAVRPAATPDSPDEAVTSGSMSVQESGMALRHACAEARSIFLSVCAQRTGVAMEVIRVEDGAFLGPDGALLGSYWTLADAQLLACEASPGARARPAGARRIAGTSAPRVDLPPKVFGAPRFIHDLRLPGMLHGRILRPPARGARLRALAEGPPLPGNAAIVRDGSFLGVVAASETAAEAAATRLAARASWDAEDTLPPQDTLDDWLHTAPGEDSSVLTRAPDAPLPEAARKIRRSFRRPFLAHGSIGPSCAVARWDGTTMEVWTHSQGIYNLRTDLGKTLRLAPEAILVRHVEGAGCYGHNGADDVALDAALLARARPGRPVRVLWSRAEELGWSPFSPAMLVEVEAGADAAGNLLSWHQLVLSNGHSSRPGRAKDPTLLAAGMLAEPFTMPPSINPPLAGGGGAQRNAVPPYRIPALDVSMKRVTAMPLRASAMRGLGALINVWAMESVMDELAALAGEDPTAYRRRHLDDARMVAVLDRACAMAGWEGRPRREGWGMGLGISRYKNAGAWCAVVAEIEAAERVFCRRLWIAADVGEPINPDGALHQIEGGAIQATSFCLLEQVQFDAQRVTSDAWERYPILRFPEVPEIAAELIARPDEPPLGAGETSLAPTIAAIAAAIHDALGVRPRTMPFTSENIAAAMDEEGA
jgi:CO/xanthine dehydrogenase Mo-binding subunit